MNVMRKLTWANVVKNKKRTIATILAIVMSTALVCGTAGIAFSALRSLQDGAILTVGDFHVVLENVPEDELKYATENEKVERYFYSKDLGYAALPDPVTAEKPYLFIRALDETALSGGFAIHLVEGRLPETDTELLLPAHLRSVGGIPWKVGDTLTLSVGSRVRDDGELLSQQDALWMSAEIEDDGSYRYDPDEDTHTETLEGLAEKTYTVVGVMERADTVFEGYMSPGFTAYTYLPESGQTGALNVALTFEKARYYRDDLEVIVSNMRSEPVIVRNWELLEYQGAISSSSREFLIAVSAVVIAIIMVTSVFVIRNSFAISVAEKRRLYGILAGVGATPRQIRRSVLYEGVLYSLVGIPLGVLSGVGAIALLLKIVSAILGDLLGRFPLTYRLSGWVVVAAVVISAVTVFFSALIPAVRASKIPPVEAVRGVRDVKTGRRSLKVSPLIKKLFGVGGVIAAKNLKRSRKKYRTTVVSLVLSVSVFIALFAFINMAKASILTVRFDRAYDVYIVAPDADIADETSGEKLQRLAAAADADVTATYRAAMVRVSSEDYASETLLDVYESARAAAAEEGVDVDDSYYSCFYIDVIAVNDAYFASYLESVGAKGGLAETVVVDEADYMKKITGAPVTGEGNTRDGTEFPFSFTPTVYTDKKPMGYEDYHSDAPFVFIAESNLGEAASSFPGPTHCFLSVSDPDAAESSLAAVTSTEKEYAGYNCYNIAAEADGERRVILVAEIFLYGFIAVITLIGVTNIFNTVTTNMLLRSREFATLRSVGMTDKEFRRMIRLESLLYGLRSLMIGVPLGLLGSVGFWFLFRDEFPIRYRFPLAAVLISALFVFLIVALTMRYTLSKINKQNVIETIRRENI